MPVVRLLIYILVIGIAFAGVMIRDVSTTSSAPAHADGDSVVSPSEVVVIGDNVEMQVKNPLKVSAGGFALNFFYDGGLVDIWPGQEVASGYVTIENVSPIPYCPEFLAVPLNPEAYQPSFSVTLDKPWEPWKGDALQPGQEIRVYVHVSLPYWAEASMPFKGLKLLVKPQPPSAPACSGGLG